MKNNRRALCFLLSIILVFGAMVTPSAATNNTAQTGAFTDIAPLRAKTGLVPLGSDVDINSSLPMPLSILPSEYNSKDEGLTLGIRAQHDNSCWAFGTLSSFETLLLKNGVNATHLSPQHTNYWGTQRADGTGWQRNHNDGGYSYIPLGYLTSWSGPINETDFPDHEANQEMYDNLSATPEYGLTEAIYFNSDANRDAIKNLIYTYGSVVGSFNANTEYLSEGSYFYCSDSNARLLGHCVSIVGWDDNFPREKFHGSLSGMPDNDGAWIIKNSWGNANSFGGYYWISYDDVWMFDKIFGPSYALTTFEEITDNVKLYQNETDGATYEFNYLSTSLYKTIVYMNAFDFEEEYRLLEEVVFECTASGADYKIYYIPFDGSTPTNDTSLWTELYSDTITYTGYICADVEDMLLPQGKGAIGVEISNERVNRENPDSPIHNTIGVCEWLTNAANKLLFLPQAEYGLSYYMDKTRLNSKVHDVMDLYFTDLEDDIGGTFVIKAITGRTPVAPPIEVPTVTPTDPSTEAPTEAPPTPPTVPPTEAPTNTPTEAPTAAPTEVPTNTPTEAPTAAPTEVPTNTPTEVPTAVPTEVPTKAPTVAPTAPPTEVPTKTPTVAPTTTIPNPDEPFMYKLGDANLDSVINVKDATTIQKHAAGLITLGFFQRLAADVTVNNIVNVIDATNILKHVAGLSVRYSIGQNVYYFE